MAGSSTDNRPRGLLLNVWQLLQDVARSPVIGIDRDEYHAKLRALVNADNVFFPCAEQRSHALREFLALHSAEPFQGTHVDELILELSRL